MELPKDNLSNIAKALESMETPDTDTVSKIHASIADASVQENGKIPKFVLEDAISCFSQVVDQQNSTNIAFWAE